MESSSEIVPVPPLCFTDEETEARQSDLLEASLWSPGSESRAHCKTPGCPHDAICLVFKNDIDLKSLVFRARNSDGVS